MLAGSVSLYAKRYMAPNHHYLHAVALYTCACWLIVCTCHPDDRHTVRHANKGHRERDVAQFDHRCYGGKPDVACLQM